MKKFLWASAAAVAMFASGQASAALLLPGTTTTFDLFSGPRGTLLASQAVAGSGSMNGNSLGATIASAVYQNGSTLDFYYQVTHNFGDPVETLTYSNFSGYSVYAFYDDSDVDGAGADFAGENNGGFTAINSTAQRSGDGSVVRTLFSFPGASPFDLLQDPVGPGEVSSTYIFRTNASEYVLGTATAQDGITIFVPAYAPSGPAVPEPATWAMMLAGFGAVGYSLRRKKAHRLVQAV